MKRYAKAICAWTLSLLSLLLAACGSAPAPEPSVESQPLDAQTIAYYEGLLQTDDVTKPQRETLYDVFTGEPQCVAEHAEEDTGLDTPYGSPYANTFSSLYDLAGKLLYAKEEITYAAGFGDYIIRTCIPSDKGGFTPDYDPQEKEGVVSSLWNYKTGEELLAGVCYLTRLDANTAIAENALHQVLGVIDRQGKPSGGFPPEQSYVWPRVLDEANGYFSAELADPMHPWGENGLSNPQVLLDREMNELAALPGYCNRANAPGYVLRNAGNSSSVLSLPEAKTVLSLTEGTLTYYDGALAIQYNQDEAYPYRLLTAEGEPLSDWYQEIQPFPSGENGPAESFLFLKDGRLEKQSRDIKLQSAAKGPVGWIQVYGDCVVYSGQQTSFDYNADRHEGLLSSELSVLVPDTAYRGVSPVYHWGNGDYTYTGLWHAMHDIDNAYLVDLLDSSGAVLAERLSRLSYVAPGLFRVEKGFEAGIMDDQGNWLYRRSKFIDFAND